MAWDFSTDPEFEQQLEWMRKFVAEEIEPLDLVFRDPAAPFDPASPAAKAMAPLKQEVKAKGLWACHLGPELGGKGFGQLKLGLMNEILGRSRFAPTVFGTQAPDTGNAEILARFGSDEQKKKYLQPLLDGEIVSCYSMTEPQAGSDPGQFTCRARLDGDEWVLDGEKWFASHACIAEFLIVMAISNPDVKVHEGSTMIIVPKDTPGMDILRNTAVGPKDEMGSGVHGYIRFTNCRVPENSRLGPVGEGFKVAQSRLGGGRIHHAMRTVGMLNKAMGYMKERVVSRQTKGERLADKQMVQEKIADSYTQILQFRTPCALCRLASRPRSSLYASRSARNFCDQGGNARGVARRRLSGASPPRIARNVERNTAYGYVAICARNGHRRRTNRSPQDRRCKGHTAGRQTVRRRLSQLSHADESGGCAQKVRGLS